VSETIGSILITFSLWNYTNKGVKLIPLTLKYALMYLVCRHDLFKVICNIGRLQRLRTHTQRMKDSAREYNNIRGGFLL
jgi:hypothetical protein